MNYKWIKSFPAAITVCDTSGIIHKMNNKAIKDFQENGDEKLLRKNLLDCHPEYTRLQVEEMLHTQELNYYTIKKN
jgi:hypothetical protein